MYLDPTVEVSAVKPGSSCMASTRHFLHDFVERSKVHWTMAYTVAFSPVVNFCPLAYSVLFFTAFVERLPSNSRTVLLNPMGSVALSTLYHNAVFSLSIFPKNLWSEIATLVHEIALLATGNLDHEKKSHENLEEE
ncbi:cofactor assembly of complex C [Striga asiatica]|uniref:Cofactor assembly of complex C n=1 Tax=Striga asiatica TaxID=4170 RepID=A0A5A7PFP3_STRAF|nr:cofactor assembly of complex C [Striga asiatica]